MPKVEGGQGDAPASPEPRGTEHFLRELERTSAGRERDFDSQIRALLALGCHELDLPIGIVTRVEDDQLRVVAELGSNGALNVGDSYELSSTFCQEALRCCQPVGTAHAGDSDWKDHPGYRNLGMEAYLGAPVRVAGTTAGTVCFFGEDPRDAAVSPTDFEVLRLLSQRIGAALESREVQSRFRLVLEGTSSVAGPDLFRAMSRHLAMALGVRYVFVGRCTNDTKKHVEVLAFWAGGTFTDNFVYRAGGRPCEEVLRNRIVFHRDGVQEAYPLDPDLADLEAASYLGVPVLGRSGETIGLLAAMDVRPMENRWFDDWILGMFANRIAGEIARMEAEDALKESEERYRATFESANVGIAHVETDGRLIRVNRKFAEMLGYTPDELVRFRVREITHPEDRERNTDFGSRAIAGEFDGYAIEKRYLHKNGSTIWGNLTVRLLRKSGQPDYFISVVEDITDRKRAEEERRRFDARVQHAQKLESLGVLAGGIAHDFNNLLTAALGHANLARQREAPDSALHFHLGQIETAAHRAAELTNQLLAYAGKGCVSIAALDLNELAQEMMSLLTTAVRKTAVLRPRLGAGIPKIEGDATQIRQVLMNLITNASDALGDQPGEIILRTGVESNPVPTREMSSTRELAPGRYLFVQVSDTGAGMDDETRKRMFDPFFTTKFVGRGLGLAAVLGIVESHRGALHVWSRPGRGTTIKILFPPATDVGTAEPLLRPKAPSHPSGGRVLVVDDEQTVRDVARIMLESAGLDVVTARDGEEALAVLRDVSGIGVVLLDVTMPRLGGEKGFQEIQRFHPGLPVILMSGYDEREAMTRLADQGTAGFLQKPFDLTELLDAVRRALAHGQPRPAGADDRGTGPRRRTRAGADEDENARR